MLTNLLASGANKMQAKKGGQYGLNGRWYEGGQFLPESELSDRQKKQQKRLKTKKQEVAPYLWKINKDGCQSIWSVIGCLVEFVGETWYSKETGKQGEVAITPNFRFTGWTDEGKENLQSLVNKWNNGEEWIN